MAKPEAQSFFRLDPPRAPEALERGRVLFAGECAFARGALDLAQLPADGRLEVCFAGRSNVGKSSLINALTGRKALARASNTPGRTQQFNFFDLAGRIWLVDLPGYGYAEAPKHIVDRWQLALKAYLRGRPALRRAFVLVDSRHGVKDVDHEIMEGLGTAAVGFQAILTKADKVSAKDFAAMAEGVKTALLRHPNAHPEIIATSSETGRGIAELRAEIAGMLA